MWETLISCLWYTPQLGAKPSTQACARTGQRAVPDRRDLGFAGCGFGLVHWVNEAGSVTSL